MVSINRLLQKSQKKSLSCGEVKEKSQFCTPTDTAVSNGKSDGGVSLVSP